MGDFYYHDLALVNPNSYSESLQTETSNSHVEAIPIPFFSYKEGFDFGGISVFFVLILSFLFLCYYVLKRNRLSKQHRLEVYKEIRWWRKWTRINLQILIYWFFIKILIIVYYFCHPQYVVFFL